MLTDTLNNSGLMHKPMQVYNCDETGMPLGAYHHKVVAQAGSNPTCITSNSSKSQVTVLACVSATGVAMPPFVIFQRKTMNRELTIGEIPGTFYGCPEKGWINQMFFPIGLKITSSGIYPSLSRPVLLLMNGHSSHFCPNMIRMATAKEKIILFILPPNTTHLTQPLDKGCFGPLKVSWRQACHRFCSQNDFSALLSEAWGQLRTSLVPSRLQNIDRCAVRVPGQKPPFRPEILAEKSGLAYVPLYSPVPSRFSQKAKVTTCEASSGLKSLSDSLHQSCFTSDISSNTFLLQRSPSENNISSFSSDEASLLLQPSHSSSVIGLLDILKAPAKLQPKSVRGESFDIY